MTQKTNIYNHIQDISDQNIINQLFSDEIAQLCYNVGIDFDKRLKISDNYEQFSISNWGFMFKEPLEEVGDKIIKASYRIQFDFLRLKNQKVISFQTLNIDLVISNSLITNISAWLPGTTIVNAELFGDIKNGIIETAKLLFINMLNNHEANLNIELCDTAITEYSNEGWKETWVLLELNSLNLVKVFIEFKTQSDGVSFSIFG